MFSRSNSSILPLSVVFFLSDFSNRFYVFLKGNFFLCFGSPDMHLFFLVLWEAVKKRDFTVRLTVSKCENFDLFHLEYDSFFDVQNTQPHRKIPVFLRLPFACFCFFFPTAVFLSSHAVMNTFCS